MPAIVAVRPLPACRETREPGSNTERGSEPRAEPGSRARASRHRRTVRTMRFALALTGALAAAAGGWQTGPPLPVPRTEVAAAVDGDRSVVAGGYLSHGSTTAR